MGHVHEWGALQSENSEKFSLGSKYALAILNRNGSRGHAHVHVVVGEKDEKAGKERGG